MTVIRCAILACLAVVGATRPAHAVFQQIYEVLGVYDDGGAGSAGVATAFHCSNLSISPVNVRVRAVKDDGTTAGTVLTRSIPGNGTVLIVTKGTLLYLETFGNTLTTGFMQGRARISTEVPSAIVCAADMVDASAFPPKFVAPRRMIRYPRGTSGGED